MNSITVPTEGGAVLAAVIPMSELYPSPSNPRKHFEGLTDLTQSIQRKGIDVPLLVRERPTAKGRFEIVDGERRYRAAQNAGLSRSRRKGRIGRPRWRSGRTRATWSNRRRTRPSGATGTRAGGRAARRTCDSGGSRRHTWTIKAWAGVTR